jgi:hypothetical protein
LQNDTEDSNHPNTLPPEELNPLLNPLLSQHMGRWAEVYFTNRPENRDHAVAELVRELKAEEARRGASTPPDDSAPTPQLSSPAAGIEASAAFARCPQCGYENPADYNFCAACRAELKEVTATGDSARPSANTNSASNISLGGAAWGRGPARIASQPRYRIYIGATLAAVVLIVLFYRAWSDGRPGANPLSFAAQAAPAAAEVKSALSTNSAATQKTNPAAATTQIAAASAPSMKPSASVPASQSPQTPVTPKPSPAEIAPTSTPHSVAPPDSISSSDGSAELSEARAYLEATGPAERNSALAATLLWKAVSRRNLQATELLSDLYLKGDGVAKNCDQARVLLDAAASNGSKDAAVRLQNLQAFGCE